MIAITITRADPLETMDHGHARTFLADAPLARLDRERLERAGYRVTVDASPVRVKGGDMDMARAVEPLLQRSLF